MNKPGWIDSKYGTSYEGIVESLGFEVLSFDTCGSYQGDHVVLLADGERRGFAVFGYGSCSGCDTLEAVQPWGNDDGDWSGVEELREDILNSIHWEPTASELADQLESDIDKSRANGTRWYWYDNEIKAVARRYIDMLRG